MKLFSFENLFTILGLVGGIYVLYLFITNNSEISTGLRNMNLLGQMIIAWWLFIQVAKLYMIQNTRLKKEIKELKEYINYV